RALDVPGDGADPDRAVATEDQGDLLGEDRLDHPCRGVVDDLDHPGEVLSLRALAVGAPAEDVAVTVVGDLQPAVAEARDQPGTYDAFYRCVAADDDMAVAIGSSSYKDSPDGPVVRVYDNCFVMRFDEEGRCREFTEWFMQRPSP